MRGHLGTRVSALLDGQLDTAEEERAWEHVQGCHQCRDAVEREGWVKTRLAGLAGCGAPAGLRGSLRAPVPSLAAGPPSYAPGRGRGGVAVLGGGAVGAAVVGVLALGIAPADLPAPDRTAPSDVTRGVRTGPPPPASRGGRPTELSLRRLDATVVHTGVGAR